VRKTGTRIFTLIGNPVRHSFSPFVMNRAFTRAGIDARYVTMPVPEASVLPAAVDGLRVLGAGGANVTYPYKEAILPYLDRLSGDAERIGAVNTLILDEGGDITGHNTDAPGTAVALERFAGLSLGDCEVHIFGSGGAARAAAWGVLSAGARAVTFAVRSPETARARLAGLREWFLTPIDCVAIDDRIAFEVADVVINATPLGMDGEDTSPVPDESWIRHGQVFFDFVYHPRRTPFLRAAARGGAKAVDGIALLVSQASAALQVWTGRGFDVVEMAAAVDAMMGEHA
jgi:shikimate dehydrogenase